MLDIFIHQFYVLRILYLLSVTFSLYICHLSFVVAKPAGAAPAKTTAAASTKPDKPPVSKTTRLG